MLTYTVQFNGQVTIVPNVNPFVTSVPRMLESLFPMHKGIHPCLSLGAFTYADSENNMFTATPKLSNPPKPSSPTTDEYWAWATGK